MWRAWWRRRFLPKRLRFAWFTLLVIAAAGCQVVVNQPVAQARLGDKTVVVKAEERILQFAFAQAGKQPVVTSVPVIQKKPFAGSFFVWSKDTSQVGCVLCGEFGALASGFDFAAQRLPGEAAVSNALVNARGQIARHFGASCANRFDTAACICESVIERRKRLNKDIKMDIPLGGAFQLDGFLF